jgi:AbrB family looped-hinge helix DNA binding protein
MPIARVLTKGQVVIPKELREKINISPGDKVEIKVIAEGIVIMPLKKTYTEKYRGIIKGKLSLEELENLYAEKS